MEQTEAVSQFCFPCVSGEARWTTAAYTTLETCLVTGLRPETSYRLRVSAANLLGRGPFSWSTVEITTKKQG